MQRQRQPHQRRLDLTRFSAIGRGLIVGVLAGFVVSVFRFCIEEGLHLVQWCYQQISSNMWLLLPWIGLSVLVAVAIGLLVKQTPDIKGSGIPQVEGQLAGELDYDWWPVLWKKFVGGILGIGSGLFLGREGPSIQLGATIGQGFAAKTKQTGADRRSLIAGGAAAGLSAAFNAPIASTLFVLEEVYHNFSPIIWTTALASAIASNFISMNFFGLVPVLHIPYARNLPISQYGNLIGLGIFLGLLGYCYQNVTLAAPGWYAKLRLPTWLDGLIPFILVIPIGLFWPQFLGGGNAVILNLAAMPPALIVLIGIFALRFIFSTVSYGSGLPGGIFLPILSLGAVLGAVYAQTMVNLGLMPAHYVTNFIIFAMAGYFAGIGKAPFTAILLITEMVGTLTHLMPLAVVSLTAYLVVDLLGGAPIYEALLEKLTQPKLPEHSGIQDRLEFPVFEGSALESHQVRDFQWPKESLLIAIRRGERQVIPHGDTLMRAGDTLIILTDRSNRAWVHHQIDRLTATTS
ncbi:ClC family H(+)/Cl(-) exchange transporter [Lactiplantibacillus mudanjiangensis]|uniref:ClC family H(+)/Cl(-) exchange transporter [Lactobacillus sp.] n=1 Tax=Lactiplantibacillus mudanjiangensis TaxID=1296538 RepID=A0A660E199_9LACO|nr:ClC family H(+)/Cl(-) exchange transporter [Lactiplantibacillus mudanjiangensis]VDG17897.1 ClC family H(+)/Cl(-) exchange transporter [Lactobacillus sp.] [Lactiplantibacillus mudanjiangensis]VDG24324.1 ClC family H(+)/Cl(-) exchange transporter [Lactobacillus sp.] [Lactiplantibacillus mudanjiangensis]VDG28310.1 ClC family H(+)/Cl(-) exchange transporter [Lactobacillus sp.] [Lactiplantibacillus mudanjiangensis]VDG32402.1 ClC family H(+)/Cl(-) exchange transporter [Lactobacillus sp.] [Lactipla